MRVRPSIFDEYHGIRGGIGFSFESVFSRKPFADIGLKRRKFEITGIVVFDYEVNGAITEVADAVEQDNCAHRKILH